MGRLVGLLLYAEPCHEADCNLRIWEPLRGSATLLPLGIRPRCLLKAGDALVIGHDDGLLSLSLAIATPDGTHLQHM